MIKTSKIIFIAFGRWILNIFWIEYSILIIIITTGSIFHRGNKPIFAWKGAKVVRSAMAIILHASLSVSCANISKNHCSRQHQQRYQPISDIIACGWLVESLKTHRTQNSSNTNFSQLAVYFCSQSWLRPVAPVVIAIRGMGKYNLVGTYHYLSSNSAWLAG